MQQFWICTIVVKNTATASNIASDTIAQIQNVPHFEPEAGQILYLNDLICRLFVSIAANRFLDGSNTELLSPMALA